MSTSRIFGTLDDLPEDGTVDRFIHLFHKLAPQNVGTPNQVNNFGLTQRIHEIIPLWELYVRMQPRIVLEVGTAQGGSFASWCHLGRNGSTIIAIDRSLDDSRPRPGESVDKMFFNGTPRMYSQGGGIKSLAQRGQTVIGINGWTHDPAVQEELKRVLNHRKIDWVFHDASHSARMYEEDVEWMWPLLDKGGVWASHDIMPSSHPDCNKSEYHQVMRDTFDYSAMYEFRGSRSDDSMGIAAFIR
jgi:cephalosporin hydroxylase